MARKTKASKGRGKKRKAGGDPNILSYRHTDKRKNNPEVGMVKPENDPVQPKTVWRYDPHLDPALQFDPARVKIEKLIDNALKSRNESKMRGVLEELKRLQEPYLTWTGKAERTNFEVDTVSLHVHERIDPASILSSVRKRTSESKGNGDFLQPDLFAAPFENLPLRDAIDFYRHERGWANRLMAGDALLVMNSLIQKESMAGQVQMIYIDPPYGIKYGSNFQPFVNKRDVKDRRDEDLTQEPEMIKAFRDTWELGIHSYLSYLRDRVLLAKDLLHESGCIFVQIGDENIHLARCILEEVFGSENFVAIITVQKTSSATSELLPGTADFLLLYAKNRRQIKFRPLFKEKSPNGEGASAYDRVELPSGKRIRGALEIEPNARLFRYSDMRSSRPPGSFPVEFRGTTISPKVGYWKTGEEGFGRLIKANRVDLGGNNLNYVRYLSDFPAFPINNVWSDLSSSVGGEKVYVVQTSHKIVERCLLMTTDPGDLVLDPTCGSGTTAYVAEKWGRRWITCDTSRVAVTLAKQRLMTTSYDYYALRYPHEGLKGGFVYKTVPHVKLKSIATNLEIDAIYVRLHPAIEGALIELNRATKMSFKEWEVPFAFSNGWPEAARLSFDDFHAARQALRKQMDFSIANHAEQETLYDQPQVDKSKLRISGPFTVEAVPFPSVLALEEAQQPVQADTAIARSGESSRQHQWRGELVKTGIRGKGGQILKIGELETLPGARYLHASGTFADTGERVVVSFGPQHAALEQRQVALALNEAEKLRPAPKFIIFCSFEFDPEAAKDIDETKWPGVTLLKAKMNTDLLTEDLKKARSNNQSFWLMGQPDVDVRKRKDGKYEVEVNGFDYFDTAKGELISGGKGKIAVWLLDTDYDERSLFPRQVFFPMAGEDDGWMKLKKDIRAELNESLLTKFHGTVSLPFEAGENHKVAVKIVDDRGIESLKIVPLD
jgi:adenine-specific DNA-methyltransferase